ncbi:MAG: Na+/H+ antiporter NhaC family protein, partial [Bacteroidota bacterium]|nr:Na+/H+ antiporter NhaC family protein [Bacteroidota bacterium]
MLDLSDAQVSLVIEDASTNTPTYHAAKSNNLPFGLLAIPLDNGSRFRLIPAWLSVLPPLLAILLALWIREVYASLFLGTFLGAFLLTGLDITALPMAFFRIIDTYLLEAIASSNGEGGVDTSHLSIIVFSLLIGGLVGIISQNGGMMTIVHRIARVAKTAKSALISTWLMGLAIFFDDYSNTLVVGSTMRPLADKLKISRAKLAYVVDSTAAPVAAIGLVTTWIGMQLSEIGKGIEMQDYVTIGASPYSLFLSSLQYALYPMLTLFFVGLVIFTNRGFGPMHKEDALAQTKESKESDTVDSKDQKASKPYLALIPLLMLVGGVVFGIIFTGSRGEASNLMEVVGASDSYLALLWGSLLSVTTAIAINLFSRVRNLHNTVEDFIEGISSM